METWRDIVDEMRNHTKVSAADAFYGVSEWVKLCDRIEAACKTLEDLLIVEQEENAKLRRALEPVMNVILGGSSLTDSYCAVSEAQAIMKEGAE